VVLALMGLRCGEDATEQSVPTGNAGMLGPALDAGGNPGSDGGQHLVTDEASLIARCTEHCERMPGIGCDDSGVSVDCVNECRALLGVPECAMENDAYFDCAKTSRTACIPQFIFVDCLDQSEALNECRTSVALAHPVSQQCAAYCDHAEASGCPTWGYSPYGCLGMCLTRAVNIRPCAAEWEAWVRCSSVSEMECDEETGVPNAPACDDDFATWLACHEEFLEAGR
jgi:hypothetical protein